jgi:hypothetical protein
MPRVHLVAGLLKRWLLGTHQGGFSAQHLDYYLNGCTFRFNRRTSRSRGKLFRRLLSKPSRCLPLPTARSSGASSTPLTSNLSEGCSQLGPFAGRGRHPRAPVQPM